jgi:hypothetical protein
MWKVTNVAFFYFKKTLTRQGFCVIIGAARRPSGQTSFLHLVLALVRAL